MSPSLCSGGQRARIGDGRRLSGYPPVPRRAQDVRAAGHRLASSAIRAGRDTSTGAAMDRSESGFTLVEVAIALVLLVVGVLALVSSSAMATRMIGLGRQATVAAQVATARLEWIRQLAGSTSPPCTDPRLAGGSALSGGIRERWEVAAAGSARRVTLSMEYRVPRGVARDTQRTMLFCRPPS